MSDERIDWLPIGMIAALVGSILAFFILLFVFVSSHNERLHQMNVNLCSHAREPAQCIVVVENSS